MKRIFDLAMASFLLCFLSVPIFVVGLLVNLTSKGPWGLITGYSGCLNLERCALTPLLLRPIS